MEPQAIHNKDHQFVAYLAVTILFTMCYYEIFWFVGTNQIAKGLIGLLMLLSEILLIILSIRSYHINKIDVNAGFKVLMGWTIVYNLAHIAYAVVWDTDVAYFTLLGNPVFQPMFMLPLVALLGIDSEYFFKLFKSFWLYIVLACIVCAIRWYVNQFEGLLLWILIAFAAYLQLKKRVALFLVAIIYVIHCYAGDDRMAVIRIIVGSVLYVVSYFSLWRYQKILKAIFLIVIIVPFYFIAQYTKTGYSVFEQSEASTRVSHLGADDTGDTRTFIYEELFEDLSENNAWLLGKGLNGTYYSSYFDKKNVEADVADRKGTEVGFLNFLLKGGIVQAVLYLLLLLWSCYNCLFRSNSKAMMLIGFILLVHYIFLFVEEIPRYDMYNIAMWFCIGMGFSNTHLEREEEYFEDRINAVMG